MEGELNLGLTFGNVAISIVPDLFVTDGDTKKLIKLDFSVESPSAAEVKIVSQAMFEAASATKLGMTAKNVLYVDVERGKAHQGAKLGARMGRDLEAACKNISAIWDSI